MKTSMTSDKYVNGMVEDNYQDREDVQVVSFAGSMFKRDIRLLASDHINSFFRDKTLSCGSPIPSSMLHTDSNLELVMNTRMVDTGIDLFYSTFEEEFDVPGNSDPNQNSPDVEFLMTVYRECAVRKIPKQFASGIAVIYLRLCAKLPRKMRASA